MIRILLSNSIDNNRKDEVNYSIEKNKFIYNLLPTEWPLQCWKGKLLRFKTSDLWRFVSKSGKLY